MTLGDAGLETKVEAIAKNRAPASSRRDAARQGLLRLLNCLLASVNAAQCERSLGRQLVYGEAVGYVVDGGVVESTVAVCDGVESECPSLT